MDVNNVDHLGLLSSHAETAHPSHAVESDLSRSRTALSADDPNRAARQCRAAQPLDAVRCDSVVLQFLAVTDFPRSGAPRMNQYGFSTDRTPGDRIHVPGSQRESQRCDSRRLCPTGVGQRGEAFGDVIDLGRATL